jgi:hypothetical protein
MLVALTPVCFAQASPAMPAKSASSEKAITDLEKSAWELYKNKQADAFKKLMSQDYCGAYAVTRYKATIQETSEGKDMSGTYNSASVWVKKSGKWLEVLHTEVKAQ